jgi:hypothetical protein
MSDTYDQTEVGGLTETTDPTPLNEILDAGPADGTGRHQDHSGDTVERFERELRQVPIAALHKEKERRKKMDARVQELERELQQYNDAKWGLDDESFQQDSERLSRDPHRDAAVQNYEKSFNSFKTAHGKERVAAIDVALKRLTPEQQQEVASLVGSPGDPVKDIEAYVQRLGLLDPAFKALSLQDVLAGKKQPESVSGDTAQIDQRFSELSQREQAIHIAEGRVLHAASRAEFIADYGRRAFDELDAVADALVQSQHPAIPQITAAMQASQSPIHTAAELLTQLGVWSPGQPQNQQRPVVMPSNLAGGRSVSPRRGPAWSGATPLQDIFDRKVPANG